ncbi:AMP nucleosidase [Sphingomicrobium lutaoense]|uniref:AMP nucleosidase n=1 Tax=Sphingomicrobium lutaoense TaxID=515949 RepID=A0A839Z151_9SPHN|nr:AMP nucleosidase [Sphingomicrobium lutaoense]MBB3763413.1 AMP nucleosidase [Sphingomicrobium lutaoense]
MTNEKEIEGLLDEIEAIYDRNVSRLRDALTAFAKDGTRPEPDASFSYPELRILFSPEGPAPTPARAFARLTQPGVYASSIARPRLFRDYLKTQLEHLTHDYDIELTVGQSASQIPYPYVLDGDLELEGTTTAELSRWFPSTELVHIGDEVADGVWDLNLNPDRPLALFDGPRTDFSLARLKHYSGTAPEHFQHYVLFTNYVRYVDEFVRFAIDELRRDDSRFTHFSVPGGMYERGQLADAEAQIAAGTWRRHQMPAYHLMAENGTGITLVNIGVGPSNAKTICDHIAVLRPEAWLMIGHCGGLRPSQTIGDYVLAHAYLRDDHVLDDVLPKEIPIPAIAEVQTAMYRAALKVTGESDENLKKRLRTGTVVTTDDRNWELRYTLSALRFNQSRAVGIDMESATVAAQGYRFRVPYGTLLCVSDKPLHGELKLPGQANSFYERAISQHLRIGIETLDILRHEGDGLHSRKLRSFDEPPLR